MRLRAVHELAHLGDAEFFSEIETGAGLCFANAARIMQDVTRLAEQGRYQAAKILQNVANEEVAKAMILLDAVRCPRNPSASVVRQLRYFADHLPKGLYVSMAELRPVSFGEVREWVDRERQQYYLDGPDGGEWLFSNSILTSREQSMYVDYIAADDSKWWHDPAAHHLPVFGAEDFRPSGIFRLVSALHAAGWFSAAALALIAEKWRPVNLHDGMTIHELRDCNQATLGLLDAKGLLRDAGDEAFGLIVTLGPFPLHPLDLTQQKVNKQELLDRRGDPAGYT